MVILRIERVMFQTEAARSAFELRMSYYRRSDNGL
jgi:hypothetical protein